MQDNLRLYWSMLLCTFIFVIWHSFFPIPPTNVAQNTAKAPATAAQNSASVEPLPASSTSGAEKQTRDHHWAPLAEYSTAPVRFDNGLFQGSITPHRGRLGALTLTQYQARTSGETKQPLDLSVVHTEGKPGGQADLDIFWDEQSQFQRPLTLMPQDQGAMLAFQNGDGLVFEARLKPVPERYVVEYFIQVGNTSQQPHQVSLALNLALQEFKSGTNKTEMLPLTGFCADASSKWTFHEKPSTHEPFACSQSTRLAGVDKQYFLVGFESLDKQVGSSFIQSLDEDILQLSHRFTAVTLKPSELHTWHFQLYMGPKRYSDLKNVSNSWASLIQYSFLGLPMDWLANALALTLGLFQQWTGNGGLAIILLTLLVKILVFPVTYSAMRSAQRLQSIRPEIERIREVFKDNPQQSQMEQIRLYQEKKINPFGGCLPNLLQIPLWYTLYQLLRNAVDLYQQSFLWLPDLTAVETWPILALLVSGLTFLQQKMTPMVGMEPTQAQTMMLIAPVMMFFVMVSLPSGLVLYFLVNTVLTIAQQQLSQTVLAVKPASLAQ
jgi:YidC/Oxa1 family membrane protein insertase